MKRFLGYIIVATNDTNDRNQYFSYNESSGGYPYWVSDIKDANLFSEEAEAEKELLSSGFMDKDIMSDGYVFPPRMVQDGAEINFAKTKGTIFVSIVELKLSAPVFKKNFTGEIKKPKGYIY